MLYFVDYISSITRDIFFLYIIISLYTTHLLTYLPTYLPIYSYVNSVKYHQDNTCIVSGSADHTN